MKARLPNRVRFWTYHNGDWVKLVVEEGRELEMYRVEATDEGWHRTYECYRLEEDGELYYECHETWRDCDGRGSSSWVARARATRVVTASEDGIAPPRSLVWEKVSRSQRDFTAEAAGY